MFLHFSWIFHIEFHESTVTKICNTVDETINVDTVSEKNQRKSIGDTSRETVHLTGLCSE